MQIEPINSFSSYAAASALQKLREYYEEVSARRLAGSNYLQELGRAAKQMEAEQARNAALFEQFRRLSS